MFPSYAGTDAVSVGLRLRDEDLVQHARESLNRILEKATERKVEVPFIGDRAIELLDDIRLPGAASRLERGACP